MCPEIACGRMMPGPADHHCFVSTTTSEEFTSWSFSGVLDLKGHESSVFQVKSTSQCFWKMQLKWAWVAVGRREEEWAWQGKTGRMRW